MACDQCHGDDAANNLRGKRFVSARAVVIGVLVAFLLMIGGLLAIPFVVEPGVGPEPAAGGRVEAFAGEAGGVSLSGELRLQAAAFELWVEAEPPAAVGPEPPRMILTMPDHPMDPVVPPVRQIEPGRFGAAGELPMPGRWRLQIVLAGEALEVPFDAP